MNLYTFNLRVLSSLLCPQNAYAANKCSLSDSFLDLLEGLINSYLVFSFFISPFTIFLRHAYCNQVYMPYLMTKRMFTTISTQWGYTKGKSHENVMPSHQCECFKSVILFANCSVIITPVIYSYHDLFFKQKQKRWVLFCS